MSCLPPETPTDLKQQEGRKQTCLDLPGCVTAPNQSHLGPSAEAGSRAATQQLQLSGLSRISPNSSWPNLAKGPEEFMPLPRTRDDNWSKTAVTMSTVTIRCGEKKENGDNATGAVMWFFLFWMRQEFETGRTRSSTSSSSSGLGSPAQRLLSWCDPVLLLPQDTSASTPSPTQLLLQRSLPQTYPIPRGPRASLWWDTVADSLWQTGTSPITSQVCSHAITLRPIGLKATLPLSMENSLVRKKVQSVSKRICKFTEAPATFSSVCGWLSTSKAKHCLKSALCRSSWAPVCQHNQLRNFWCLQKVCNVEICFPAGTGKPSFASWQSKETPVGCSPWFPHAPNESPLN